jgi:RNA polymerase sigma factor (sigma-70 family)
VDRSHAADVELARLCEAGDEQAWLRFVLEYRPVLYRAADALDRTGGARELADSLYADLYGLKEDSGERNSLFRYFHGRSSLATWLRAVLAQRYVDRLRAQRRLEPLPDESGARDDFAATARSQPEDPDRARYLTLMRAMIGHAVAALGDRDRLRLACYYVQELTLAETGRLLQEHEATVSRQLARTRRGIRAAVERQLRAEGLSEHQMSACFASVAEDPGPIDLTQVFQGPVEGAHHRRADEPGADHDPAPAGTNHGAAEAGDYNPDQRRKRDAPERAV